MRVHVSQPNTTAIKAIAPARRSHGMLLLDTATGKLWRFDEDSTADAAADVLVPDAGGGRFLSDDAKIAADLASTSTGKGASLVGLEDAGGLFTASEVEGALAEVKTIADALTGAVKRTVTVAYNNAAFVAANSNGTAAVVNIGATLPANARILSCDARSFTAFSGGSISTLSMKIGTSGDDDALVSASDMVAAAVDGGPSTFTRGIRPNKTFISSGAQLIATFTPDGSHKLSDLSAGSITIDVFYMVAA